MINMISATNAETFPMNGALKSDPGEKDLYADLFESLFTVPVKPPEIPTLTPKPADNAGGNTGNSQVNNSENNFLDLFTGDRAGGTKLDRAANNTGGPVEADDVLGLFSADRKYPKNPIQLIGPPIQEPPIVAPIPLASIKPFEPGKHDRLPVPVTDPCLMPPRSTKILTIPDTGISVSLPVDGDHSPIDIVTLEEHDHPVEAGSADLGVSALADQIKKADEKAIEILSSSQQVPTQEVMISAAVAGVNPFPPNITFGHASKVLDLQSRPEKTDEPSGGEHDGSLLETFTNNLFVDTRSSATGKSLSSDQGAIDTDGLATEFTDKKEDIPKTDGASEFSFDSSIAGETVTNAIEPTSLSDAKVKRLIMDQVGSPLADLALAQKGGEDSKVIKIRLTPEELGTVEITLAKNADGVIDAHFQTDSPHTQSILNETMAQLRESLERMGMLVGNLDTSCTSFSSGGQDQNANQRTEFELPAEKQALATTFENNSKNDDAQGDRLVNLRA